MSVPTEMELVVDACGDVTCIYDEGLDLREIGRLQITRASHVEPDVEGFWWADMGPINGPVLGPYGSRSDALRAEQAWLITHLSEVRLRDSGPVRAQVGSASGNTL